MGVSFPKFSWWLWSGTKEKAVISNSKSSLSSLSSVSECDSGFREPDETLKFPTRIALKERNGKAVKKVQGGILKMDMRL